jgi:hypothetical protein
MSDKITMVIDEPTESDYIFVIGSDGELKSFYSPSALTSPFEVCKILNMYGIEDVEDITGSRMLH